MTKHTPIVERGSHVRNRLFSIFMVVFFFALLAGVFWFFSGYGALLYPETAAQFCKPIDAIWEASVPKLLPALQCAAPWPYQPIVLAFFTLMVLWFVWKPIYYKVIGKPRVKFVEGGFETVLFKPSFLTGSDYVFINWDEITYLGLETRLFFLSSIRLDAVILKSDNKDRKITLYFPRAQLTEPSIAKLLKTIFEKFPELRPEKNTKYHDLIERL